MGNLKRQRPALVVVGLMMLGSAHQVLGHPPMPSGWLPPPPPMPSIAVYFPPLVLGAPHAYAPVYPGGRPRHYMHPNRPYYRDYGHGHHGHHRHGHHHEDWD